jgi:PAS domain-containing protein
MLDIAPLGILLLSKELTMVDCNDFFVKIMGAPNKEFYIGKNLRDFSNAKATIIPNEAEEVFTYGAQKAGQLEYLSHFAKGFIANYHIYPIFKSNSKEVEFVTLIIEPVKS